MRCGDGLLMISRQKLLHPVGPVLSPLSLLILSACVGGGGGSSTQVGTTGTTGTTTGTGTTVSGAVVKGPLQGADVYLDLDGNGIPSAGDLHTVTDENGAYSFGIASTAAIIAVTNSNTIDTSSNTSLNGVTLRAPAGATVVSPATTVLVATGGGLSAEQVGRYLGLPEGVDPLTYNPYAEGQDIRSAWRVEVISQQLITTVNAFSAAAEGSGLTQEEAYAAAFDAVVKVVQDRAAAGGGVPLDFTSAADLTAIRQGVVQELATTASTATASGRGIDLTAFNALAGTAETAVLNVNSSLRTTVNQLIQSGATLTADEIKDTLATTSALVRQVSLAAEQEVANPGGGASQIMFANAAVVQTSLSSATPSLNTAPVIRVNNLTDISENVSQAVVADVAATDLSGNGLTVRLSGNGPDDGLFEIVDGQLRIKASADFESQSTFRVQLSVTDGANATTVKNIEFNVLNQAETLSGTIVDGYVAGATIFQDLNNNNVLDAGEPFTVTSSTGEFTLPGVVSSVTSPLKMIAGFDIGTNAPIVTSLGAPTMSSGPLVASPLGTVAALVQANTPDAGLRTVLDRVARYFEVDQSSLSHIDLVNDDALLLLRSSDTNIAGAARDVFSANQYVMALAHSAESMGKYTAGAIDAVFQQILLNNGVTDVPLLANTDPRIYQKLGADAFMEVLSERLSPSTTSASSDTFQAGTPDSPLRIFVSSASVYEGDETPTVVVRLNRSHDTDVTVTYKLQSLSDDTALAGRDFISETGSITILAGYTSETINLPLKMDNEFESPETFSVVLTNSTTGEIAQASSKVTLFDSSRTLSSSGEVRSLAVGSLDKYVASITDELAAGYNQYASEQGESWTISGTASAFGSVLPGIRLIVGAFGELVGRKIIAAWVTEDAASFAEALMVANAATKSFDAGAYLNTYINGDGTFVSGQNEETFLAAITADYEALINLYRETIGDVFGDDTSANFANATVAILTDGADTKAFTSASEIIATFNGNDVVFAGGGNDKVIGGADVDKLYGEAGNDVLYGYAGNDTLEGGEGNDKLVGGLGDDVLSGGAGDDYILAQTGNDTITTGTGNDEVIASLGDDIITVDGSGAKTIDGGTGTDTLRISNISSMADFSSKNYNTSSEYYTLTTSSNDEIRFKAIEALSVGSNSYSLILGDGSTRTWLGDIEAGYSRFAGVFFDSSNNEVYLFDQNSESSSNITNLSTTGLSSYGIADSSALAINGSEIGDFVVATGGTSGVVTANLGAGDDQIVLGNKANIVDAGSGDDIIFVSTSATSIPDASLNGGDGIDTISFGYWGGGSSQVYTLNTGATSNFENIVGSGSDDQLTGSSDANAIFGGSGSDTLYGLSGDDKLYGDIGGSSYWSSSLYQLHGNLREGHGDNENEFGDDILFGGAGSDTLVGDKGNDQLDGGTGSDTITTGSGSDTIVLRAGDGGSAITDADTITDFADGTDVLGLDDGLLFTDLTIAQGTGDNANDTIISKGSEYLAILQGVKASAITEADFTPVDIL